MTFLLMRKRFTSTMCPAVSSMFSISTNASCEYGSYGITGTFANGGYYYEPYTYYYVKDHQCHFGQPG